MNIGTSIKHQRVQNAAVAAATDLNTTVVDRQGFAGVKWTVMFGAISATCVAQVKLQHGAKSDGSDMTDLASTFTTALANDGSDDNKAVVIDLYTDTKRYVRAVIHRGTANAVVDGAIAELYGPAIEPVTQDATVKQLETVVGPAEGTP